MRSALGFVLFCLVIYYFGQQISMVLLGMASMGYGCYLGTKALRPVRNLLEPHSHMVGERSSRVTFALSALAAIAFVLGVFVIGQGYSGPEWLVVLLRWLLLGAGVSFAAMATQVRGYDW